MCSYSTVSDWLGARFFLERPPARKFLPTWSLPCVLEALAKAPFEPLAEASLRDVTIKTVFLMAIASGHRRSALRALPAAPGHIRWDGVRLIPNPSYVAKNQTASSKPVEIFLSSLSRHTHRCPTTRSGVLKYLSRTKDRRSGDQFFICTREPFSPASRDVISKWIVAAIRAAGPSVLSPGVTPRAHDTRSIRRVLGVVYGGFSVEEIRQPIGSRLILHLLFTFGMSPPPSCLFLVQPCWRRHFPVNPIHCPLWGSRSQASRTFSVWV